MSFNLRKLVRNRRKLGAIGRIELDNLRNRLDASKLAKNYNDRTHVDVPAELLERMIDALEGMVQP
jgi:hypothetical protein